MLFNSYIFILAFLPLTVLGYFLLNKYNRFTASKVWLLCMSLCFYGYFNIAYLPIIVGSILVNYVVNRLLLRLRGRGIRIFVLVLGLLANLGVLFYFKYYDFFMTTVNSMFGTSFHLLHILLPLGISFFTFQQLSYVVDCYKRAVPNYSFLDYALFVTFFPQLIAGPIVLHSEIVPQFADCAKKHFNSANFSKGLYAFAIGLAKKVLIADVFGTAANWGFGNIDAMNTPTAIFVMLAYTLQIYFDFSGYCDMATGIGLLFNIDIPMNFNSPYKSTTIDEFWKRWHITLTRFFTTFIYIPLGGNRKGRLATYCNVMIVFLVSGLWHGANYTFILWGALHGVASVLTRIFKKWVYKVPYVVRLLINFLFINLTWVYFRANTIADGTHVLQRIFSADFGKIAQEAVAGFDLPEFSIPMAVLGLFPDTKTYIIAALYLAFALFVVFLTKNTNQKVAAFRPSKYNAFQTVVLLVWSVISLSAVSTFLYFNF